MVVDADQDFDIEQKEEIWKEKLRNEKMFAVSELFVSWFVGLVFF